MDPVSDHRWYETEEEAVCGAAMPLRMSLNGRWHFFCAPNPDSVPEGFEQPEFSCEGWDTIPVPAQMELCGYGAPHYRDTDYPWNGIEDVKPHEIPEKENPTGCYVTAFSVPEQMKGKRLQIHFEGVETAFHFWINGQYGGYSEDSYTPAVFDITDLVQEGEKSPCGGSVPVLIGLLAGRPGFLENGRHHPGSGADSLAGSAYPGSGCGDGSG